MLPDGLLELVGYGDFYSRTLLGRLVIFAVSLWGTTIISLMVVTLTNTFALSSFENKVLHRSSMMLTTTQLGIHNHESTDSQRGAEV